MEEYKPQVERDPIGGGNDENFDKEGNPRTLRTMPDDSSALLSEQEYLDELEAYKESHR
jgi:hypothetical protein